MADRKDTPESVIERIDDIRRRLNGLFAQRKTERLLKAWADADTRLTAIHEESRRRPQVTISLVGGTGAGKSTLLNALLDARILPVSEMRACTAAISNVAYADQPHYEADVRFIGRDVWQKEVEVLLGDLADSRRPDGDGDGSGAAVIAELSGAAKDKIKAVYSPITDEEVAQFTPILAKAKEPVEITRAFEEGSHRVTAATLDEFRHKVAMYLSSGHRFWPIVQSVEIRGPFESLRSGAALVDLPGLNDPNEAREAVTNRYLKTCRFVWIVFNVKRVLTKDMMAVILSDDFRRRIVMDGRAGALTFVGTHADDFEFDGAREELRLPDDATETDVLLARNDAVRAEVQAQLREHSARLVVQAGEDGSRIGSVIEAFQRSRVFTISAKEYLRLRGHTRSRPAGMETVEQTEVIALRDHIDTICAEYGVEAHARSLHRQIDMIWEELVREVMIQKAYFDRQREASQQQMKRMEVEAEKARTFLETSLATIEEACAQDFETSQEVLKERLKRAIERARSELNVICGSWNNKHWATLRAVARRGGRFSGTTGTHDLPAEITKPILDGITFAWTDYFGDKLGARLEKRMLGLLRICDEHRLALLQVIEIIKDAAPDFHKGTADIIAATERILKELLENTTGAMQEKIEARQRDLYEVIPGQVRANMAKAFDAAGAEQGSGMKGRMVSILTNHARDVSAVMFQDVERTLSEGVRSLSDWLKRQFSGMTATVRHQSDIALQNLRTDTTKLSTEEVESALEAVAALQRVLSALAPEASATSRLIKAMAGDLTPKPATGEHV